MNNWFFGYGGGISFNSGSPVYQPGGKVYSPEGCATVSDEDGNLLFYTDGIRIWDRTHALMPNSGLRGDTIASQSSVIVQYPGSKFLYYVFCAGSMENNNGKLSYSIVDIRLHNGLGDIVSDKKNILLADQVCEKITAIKHPNTNDVYFVTHKYLSDEFLVGYINCNGIAADLRSFHIGQQVDGQIGNAIGYIKGSPDGKRLAIANLRGTVEVFDFDNETGNISNSRVIGTNVGKVCQAYGVEFSPDSKLLYVSSTYNCGAFGDYDISQYQLDAVNINATKTFLLTGRDFPPGAMQLGPDNRIYIAFGFKNYLGAINAPNVSGPGCNLVQQQVTMPADVIVGLGLPNVVSGYDKTLLGQDTSFCTAFSLRFTPLLNNTSYLWSNGNLTNDVIISTGGTYWLQIKTEEGCVYTDTLDILAATVPEVKLGEDRKMCPGEELVLNVSIPESTVKWEDGTTMPSRIVSEPGTYSVSVENKCGVGQDQIIITEGKCMLRLPNAFTPAKTTNNIFKMSNARAVKDFAMFVYNRWGQLIYKTNNAIEGWNGTINGMLQPVGTYAFVVSYTDPETSRKQIQKGTLNLIR